MAAGARIEQAGLIVVGGGTAGMVAAIAAADHGHRVVLLERAKDLGGLAATSSECIAAAGTRFQRVADVVDAPDRLRRDIDTALPDHGDAALADALVAQGAALVEWLADRCDVQVRLQSTTAQGGHGVARLHSVGDQGGASLIAALTRAASHHTHIRVRTATEADRLVPTDDGGVAGVALRPDRRGTTIINGPVVLACGGYVGDDELIAKHAPELKELPYLGPAGAKGDALRLTAPLGAAMRHGAAGQVTALLAQPSHLSITSAVLAQGAIIVNQRGARFTDESQATSALALAVRGQPGRVGYLLFDERIASAVAAHDPFFARVVLPRTSRRASSIGMLAKQLELPETALRETLDGYTRGLAEPYYGVRVTGARRTMRGGLAVDAGARVLDASGNAILGLFAVGGAAANLSGPGIDRELEGIDALSALGLARLAALGMATASDES
jgi:fumarate reductase flavoprotein subunit